MYCVFQIIELLHIKDKLVADQFLRVATSVISSMMTQNPDKAERYVLRPLLKPLYACLDDCFIEAPDCDTVVLVGEDALTASLDRLYKVFIGVT